MSGRSPSVAKVLPDVSVVAVDAGNSAVKVARVVNGSVQDVHVIAIPQPGGYPPSRDDLEAALVRSGGVGGSVALASVVPATTAVVREVAQRIGAVLLEATAETVPLRTAVARPDRLGADRLLAGWAARERYGAPVVVVDLGTATTVDVVDAEGVFQGGAILPGMRLGLDALALGTALLPAVTLVPPPGAIGRDTAAAIRSGVVLGHLGAIREIVARMTAELGDVTRPRVVVTGGLTDADWAAEAFLAAHGDRPPIADHLDPDLVLRGLGLLGACQPAVAP